MVSAKIGNKQKKLLINVIDCAKYFCSFDFVFVPPISEPDNKN